MQEEIPRSTELAVAAANQETYASCYTGRQGWWYHASYMRLGKVYMLDAALRAAGVSLAGKDIFDYGFGSGTFLRRCPVGSRLFGVETDQDNVSAVEHMLHNFRHKEVKLDSIDVNTWETHAALSRRYDVIACSHVLEHLPDPVGYLMRIKECISPGGVFVAAVPVNERVCDPRHLWKPNAKMIHEWVKDAGMSMEAYVEGDPWLYWVQPLMKASTPGIRHCAQAVRFFLGIAAAGLGERAWRGVGRVFGAITRAKPTQAAFVCRAESANQR